MLIDDVEAAMFSAPVDYGGRCSLFKGRMLASLVARQQLRTVVEIGVHHGRSLLALAVGASRIPGARVTGIDPYDAGAYVAAEATSEVRAWVSSFDFAGAYAGVLDRLSAAGLAGWCEIVRETSEIAAARFPLESIDLLHVDGDHGESAVTLDLATYLPRVRPGGYVVMDDVSWPTVRGTAWELQRRAELVFSLTDIENRSGLGWNDFLLCRLP